MMFLSMYDTESDPARCPDPDPQQLLISTGPVLSRQSGGLWNKKRLFSEYDELNISWFLWRLLSFRRSLWLSSSWKHKISLFLFFVRQFCLPGSGCATFLRFFQILEREIILDLDLDPDPQPALDPERICIRIRIHRKCWIRIRIETIMDPKHWMFNFFRSIWLLAEIFSFKFFLCFFQEKEIDYCHILNRNLPDDIKVTAWAPCPTTTFRCLAFPSHKEYFALDQFFPKAVKLLTRSGPIPGHNQKASFFWIRKIWNAHLSIHLILTVSRQSILYSHFFLFYNAAMPPIGNGHQSQRRIFTYRIHKS